MKKRFEFYIEDNNYILKNTNPNEKKSPFVIEKETLEFNSEKFYNYVFQDISEQMDIEVVNLLDENSLPKTEYKDAKRIYDSIEQICREVMEQMNKKL